LKANTYYEEFVALLTDFFVSNGHVLTSKVELDPTPESKRYSGLIFSLDGKKCIYRKANITPERPGAFVALWKRPSPMNLINDEHQKPIPLTSDELDYLFIQVEQPADFCGEVGTEHFPQVGLFIFPVSLLMEKGVIASITKKGKTGFRVFPPWTKDRGKAGIHVFSASAKKTQRWQQPYFVVLDEGHYCVFPLLVKPYKKAL